MARKRSITTKKFTTYRERRRQARIESKLGRAKVGEFEYAYGYAIPKAGPNFIERFIKQNKAKLERMQYTAAESRKLVKNAIRRLSGIDDLEDYSGYDLDREALIRSILTETTFTPLSARGLGNFIQSLKSLPAVDENGEQLDPIAYNYLMEYVENKLNINAFKYVSGSTYMYGGKLQISIINNDVAGQSTAVEFRRV